MTDVIPEYAPEPAVYTGKRGMPGWAVALAVALVATCAAVMSIVLTVQAQDSYHHDIYTNCVSSQAGATKTVKALTKLRDADQSILDASAAHPPTTEFGRVDLIGIQQRVDAYNGLLSEIAVAVKFDCKTLK